MTPTCGEKDIMYEPINIIAASRKVERMSVVGAVMFACVASSTVINRSGRRTESARASSGNLH